MVLNEQRTIRMIISITLIVLTVLVAVFTVISLTNTEGHSTHGKFDDLNKFVFHGAEDAPVTVVEFGDYQCPACAAWNLQIFPLLKKDFIETGKVKFYFINFPFIGPDSYTAANIGKAISMLDTEAFWLYNELVYANQRGENDGWASEGNLFELIEKHIPSVDLDKIKELHGSRNLLLDDDKMVKENYINATPTIFINDTKVISPFNYEVLTRMIERKL